MSGRNKEFRILREQEVICSSGEEERFKKEVTHFSWLEKEG